MENNSLICLSYGQYDERNRICIEGTKNMHPGYKKRCLLNLFFWGKRSVRENMDEYLNFSEVMGHL